MTLQTCPNKKVRKVERQVGEGVSEQAVKQAARSLTAGLVTDRKQPVDCLIASSHANLN